MQKKQQTGVIMKNREPDEKEDSTPSELHEICKDIIKAINSNDSEMLSKLMKECFEHCEKQPHEETNSYDDMNEKAAGEQE